MPEPLLSVKNLRVEYLTPSGPIRAVDDVSFDVAAGEVFGLAGESGCGKSTLALAALRLLPPPAVITGGEVWFEGEDILAMDDVALASFRWRKISLVFQSAMNALNPVLTVGAQICDVIEKHEGVSRSQALKRAAELLELMGIASSRLRSYPHQLSGGMRQRVVIAIALALKPPMMFMDEPTTALDVVVQQEIMQQIAALKRQLGFSILFITHDLSLMLEFSDRIGILYAGKLVELSRARQLFEAPRHPYTRGLMSSFPALRGPRRRLEGILGSPPDMSHPPAGCRFHPRCTEALPRCRAERPALLEVAPGAEVACHLYPEPARPA
ncbi:MAG TPA: ABC transporter ATP-binding protein [Polyangiaceae bacterium]